MLHPEMIGNSFKGGNSSDIILPPSEKECTIKGKNLLLLGANSFLLEYTSFQKGFGVYNRKQGGTIVVYLGKNDVKSVKLLMRSIW